MSMSFTPDLARVCVPMRGDVHDADVTYVLFHCSFARYQYQRIYVVRVAAEWRVHVRICVLL